MTPSIHLCLILYRGSFSNTITRRSVPEHSLQCIEEGKTNILSESRISQHPVHVLEKETVYMKNNMEIKFTEIKMIVHVNEGVRKKPPNLSQNTIF